MMDSQGVHVTCLATSAYVYSKSVQPIQVQCPVVHSLCTCQDETLSDASNGTQAVSASKQSTPEKYMPAKAGPAAWLCATQAYKG